MSGTKNQQQTRYCQYYLPCRHPVPTKKVAFSPIADGEAHFASPTSDTYPLDNSPVLKAEDKIGPLSVSQMLTKMRQRSLQGESRCRLVVTASMVAVETVIRSINVHWNIRVRCLDFFDIRHGNVRI